MLRDSLSLDDRESSFAELPFNDQCDLIEKLLLLCRGNKKSLPINLSSIGGAKTAGRLRPARSSVPDDFVIVDQSVTGMFERKTRVGL